MRLINLIPLHEIDFPSQAAFDRYNKQHKLRPDTKVVVAGRVTTAGRASKVGGTSVFGNDDKLKKYGDNAFNQMMADKDKKEPKRVSLSDEMDNIKDLTDKNDHNGAVMALAKMMDDKSSIAIMDKIQKHHKSKGHMPQSIIKYRTDIMKNLLVKAERRYGSKFAKQLQNSF
jgi:hypothetical protein